MRRPSMTGKRLAEIVRTGKSLDYELGREAAQRHIAEGRINIYDSFLGLAAVFGKEWTRGYEDYIDAWKTIHSEEFA